ncbi:carboxymuconolactone decarboxylase family protein [Jeotgalibacillus campisalis]|uniref:Putative carboxymuconolactone decarboxylase n=1 Tax=Jeotgalibacillus campisalis TaxID=220754 RepID=A0A0C2W4K9_9BACL|nr:carboxymuconolactone decarboxylase family protein [Jeotgalibacillus campisalis]KIL50983.1 putative carboxymuconolactone decarboxylase [Jeotgalibacillus campisalis]
MILNGEKILDRYRKGIEEVNESLPEAISEYNRFTGKAFESGEIDRSQKHLTALAIAVKDGDESSIAYHMDQCIGYDCTDQEIHETMMVAAAYGGGSAMSHGVTMGLELLKQFRNR